MNLSKIYGSKLYLTSDRQDSIHAAIQNPLNIELVQQISEYLDDESKEDLAEAISSEEEKEQQAAESKSNSEGSEENVFDEDNVFDTSSSAPSSGSASHSSFSAPSGGSSNPFDDDFESIPDDIGEGGEPKPSPDANSDSEPSAPAPAPADDIEESTEITCTEDIDTEDAKPELQSGIIKKLLNTEDDTQGVARVDINDSETWIYYDDKVNLNDIFDNVIALLKDSKYDMLKFSRLARTDNAVVFDIKE